MHSVGMHSVATPQPPLPGLPSRLQYPVGIGWRPRSRISGAGMSAVQHERPKGPFFALAASDLPLLLVARVGRVRGHTCIGAANACVESEGDERPARPY